MHSHVGPHATACGVACGVVCSRMQARAGVSCGRMRLHAARCCNSCRPRDPSSCCASFQTPHTHSNKRAASKRSVFDWLAYFLPCLRWLRTYDIKSFLVVSRRWGLVGCQARISNLQCCALRTACCCSLYSSPLAALTQSLSCPRLHHLLLQRDHPALPSPLHLSPLTPYLPPSGTCSRASPSASWWCPRA